jgi:hypothetical protein
MPLLVVLILLAAPWTVAWAQAPADPALETALLNETNRVRAEHGLAPLRADAGLARAARAHAAENAARGVLDHGSPDADRDTPAERVARAGVALVEIGENLARIPGDDVAARALDGWLASPPHRRNLLDPAFTHVGFGTAVGPGGRYLVQLLGARPWIRTRAEARVTSAPKSRWVVEVRGPVGVDVAAFLAGAPVAAATLGPNGARFHLPVRGDAAARLEIGTARPGTAHLRSDAGVLDPSTGWRRDAGLPDGQATVTSATLERRVVDGVEVVLVYADPDPELQLFVDGRHLPGVVPSRGALRARLPAADAPRRIAVGIPSGDGRARVLERFTLLPGPPPRLVPGVPALGPSATSAGAAP